MTTAVFMPIRYWVCAVPNELTGERYEVLDRNHDNAVIAEFRDLVQTYRDDKHQLRYRILDEVGRANADAYCKQLNDQWEANRV